jgi:diguanylate cyclase (GGDEF)-like protein
VTRLQPVVPTVRSQVGHERAELAAAAGPRCRRTHRDRFGHQVGDQALASVGAALRSALRDSDFAGRNGGEEFAVMLPNTDVAGALATAERIRGAIADISMPGSS